MTIRERLYHARPYLWAVTLAVAGAALRLPMQPFLDKHAPYLTIYPPVIVAAVLWGKWPGAVAALVGHFAADFFFVQPPFQFHSTPTALLSFAIVLGSALFLGHLCDRLREARAQARAEASATRAAEEKLRASEQRLRILLDASLSGIAISEKGRLVDLNDQFAAILGYQREELIGTEVQRLLPPEDAERVMENIRCGKDSLTDHRVIRKDGSIIHVEAHGKTIEIEGRAVRFTSLRDITERKRAELELARSNEELEHFASVVSHDLRSPMMTLSCCSQILELECRDCLKEGAREAVAFIRQGVTQMNRLITALLDYSRIGRGQLQPVECSMQEVLGEAIAGLKARLAEAQAEVTSEALPTVQADRTLMAQLFQNLVENAVKYRADEPPRIHVSATLRRDEWIFSVRDNGIGIPPEHRERIFVVFNRLHSDESKSAGLGLGLATCKRIVERHRGQIWVEPHQGRGSTFCFSLPLSAAGPARRPAGTIA